MITRTVHFRGTEIPVSEQDYRSLAIIGAETAHRFFTHLDAEAHAGANHLRGAVRGKAKPDAEGAKAEKAKQLHDVVALMRRSRGQAT